MKLSELLTDPDPRKWPRVRHGNAQVMRFLGVTPFNQYIGYSIEEGLLATSGCPDISEAWEACEEPKIKIKRWLWVYLHCGLWKMAMEKHVCYFSEEELRQKLGKHADHIKYKKLLWSETEFDE